MLKLHEYVFPERSEAVMVIIVSELITDPEIGIWEIFNKESQLSENIMESK